MMVGQMNAKDARMVQAEGSDELMGVDLDVAMDRLILPPSNTYVLKIEKELGDHYLMEFHALAEALSEEWEEHQTQVVVRFETADDRTRRYIGKPSPVR